MRTNPYLISGILIIALMTSCANNKGQDLQKQEATTTIAEVETPVTTMQLISDDFKDKGNIPQEFTCQEKDISPHLQWKNIPNGTKSFAISVTDPDAYGRTWIHWLIINIPANVTEFQKDTYQGIQVPNDFVKPGYGGPCPPSGKHRYFFTVHALDTEDLAQGINLLNFFERVNTHTIEKAELVGMYQKK